jgi:DMSO/TMAO reductase YedYZ molybdopterin-dependent catalytic subunit
MSEADSTAGQAGAKNASKGLSKNKLISLVVVVALLIAVPIGYLYWSSTQSDGGSDETLVYVTGKSSSTELSLSDLEGMVLTEQVSSYQNSFMNWKCLGTYSGVNLSDIADLVGGMVPGDIMTITASDGYVQNLTYYQVYPDEAYLSVQGPIVLSYKFNGTVVPDWEDGLQIAVLAPDQAFSNADLNQTVSRDPECLSTTSAGSIWVKNVERINITSVHTDEWTVNLTDLSDVTTVLTRTEVVRLAYYNGAEYTDDDANVWSGPLLSSVIGMVDDDDPTTYNATVADTLYQVKVIASDGYSKSAVAKDLVANDTFFANMLNGEPLPADYAPLRMMGAVLSGSYKVSMIETIEMVPPTAVTVTAGDSVEKFNIDQLMALDSFEGNGTLIKSTGTIAPMSTWVGVPLNDLIGMVFEGTNYSLEVVASDGYTMTYSSGQVEDGTFAYYDDTGALIGEGQFTMLLAYEQDGVILDSTELRIVIVDDDSDPITDGHFWAKYVKYINVVSFVQEWTLNISGLTTYSMDRQTFEAVASCEYHALDWTFEDETGTHTYSGVALWILISAVDGADGPESEYLFNDLLALSGYTVTVTATDGYYKTFDSLTVARNDSFIVANKLDGVPLADDEFPLKLVGPYLSGSQMVKQIANISLSDIGTTPSWNVTFVGLETVVFDAAMFVSLYECGVHNVYYNYSDGTDYYNYSGIPLWMMLAMVDGEEIDHYEFNDTLATLGYNVTITGSGGFSITLTAAEIAYNDGLFLAIMVNGAMLEGELAPVALVGESLFPDDVVPGAVTVEMIDLPE